MRAAGDGRDLSRPGVPQPRHRHRLRHVLRVVLARHGVPHAVRRGAGRYTLETFLGGGTFNLNWFVEKFSGVDPRALGLDLTPEQVLETAAAKLPPGSDGLLALPYWAGALTPYWDHTPGACCSG